MTSYSFSFKAKSDMLRDLQSKKNHRTPDQWYCCYVLCGLSEIWLHQVLSSAWLGFKPNISEQLGKALLLSTSHESHAKGQHASLGERCDALQECQIKVKYPAFQGYQRCKIFTFVHHNQYQTQSMKWGGKVCVDFSSDRAEFVSWMGGRIFWKNLS